MINLFLFINEKEASFKKGKRTLCFAYMYFISTLIRTYFNARTLVSSYWNISLLNTCFTFDETDLTFHLILYLMKFCLYKCMFDAISYNINAYTQWYT